jgi:four helix bundle protein
MENKKYDLLERLIDFAVSIIGIAESLPNTSAGNHIKRQILRSGTSPAPNYGESQSAESRSDFIHKVKIALKELRETKVWLLIIYRKKMIRPEKRLQSLIKENDELISILFRCVDTAKKNLSKK